MLALLVVLVSTCAHSLAMRSVPDALKALNATEFLKLGQQLNDKRILGGDPNGPYTLLVPTDEAFSKQTQTELNNLANTPGLLDDVVGFHIIPGELFSFDFKTGRVLTSSNGHFLRMYIPSDSNVYINDAKVVRADEEAEGVVIILIDRVLDVPEGTINAVVRKPEFALSAFAGLLDVTGMNRTLQTSPGPYTVFAPSQAAFDRLSDVIKDELARNQGLQRHVVEYHIHRGTLHVKSLDRNGTLSTLYNGHNIDISVIGDIMLNGVATLEEVDIDCDNGVIHIIDHVLLPTSVGTIIG